MPRIHWEVIDDSGTRSFRSYEEAYAYYEEGVKWANDPESEYTDQIHLQCVVSLRHYENGEEIKY